MPRYCIHEDCKTKPSYGIKGDDRKNAKYCKKHKLIDHVNIVSKRCIFENCNIFATFGCIGSKNAQFCKSHKLEGYIDVISKKCLFENCVKQPIYGKKGDPKKNAKFCSNHKPIDYVNIVNKKCMFMDCIKKPIYGKKGEPRKNAEFCANHKLIDYVDIYSKKCLFENCNKIPKYGVKNSKYAEFCTHHKPINYINVINKKCLFEGCIKQPIYGKIGELRKNAKFCGDHKPFDYVNIVTKRCEFKDCEKYPSYGTKDAKYCKIHKQIDHIDFKHKKCISKNCNILSSYGPLFKEKIHCASHKTLNDYKNNKPICEYKDCKISAYYVKKNSSYPYPTRCEEHFDNTYYNIVEKECTKCNLVWIVNENGLCNDCSEFFKEKPKTRKEKIVVNYLKTKNDLKIDSTDKIPDGSCNKYRPDIVYDFGTHIIIIEIDENQHKTYECMCEQARMINITQDYGGIPVTFIRFNPDSYIDKNNKKQNSKIEDRLGVLSETIDKIKNVIPKELCNVIYLYYDEFDKKDISIDTINIY